MRFEAGALFANYTVVSRLGRGGMATVYLVREHGIDRLVALKVLPEQLVDDEQFAARFEQEARVIGGLDHPNIIPLYRYGITDDVPWMALRYVDGGDFASRLMARPVSVPEGLSILHGVAAALDYAHRKGVIHRDLKPQNILLTSDGVPYLADFGVAKLLEGASKLKTATGGILGTPAYMAPEQVQGLQLGPYTDVYALAVICFQWLTGSLPFDADTPHAILLKHVMEPLSAEALGQLSPSVAAVLERALAKKSEQRFQAASTMIAALEHALFAPVTRATGSTTRPVSTATRSPPRAEPESNQGSPDEAPEPSGPAYATWASADSRRGAIVLLALALTLAIGGYVYWELGSQPAPAPSSRLEAPAERTAATTPADTEKLPAIQSTAEEIAETQRTVDKAAATRAAEEQAAEQRLADKRAADMAAAQLAAAKNAAEKRAAQERAAAAAAAAIQGTLVVKAAIDCNLIVNGEAEGTLQANQTKLVKVGPGEQLIECIATDGSGESVQQTKSVIAGAQVVVVLNRVDAKSEPEPQLTERFVDQGSGVLKDARTGLEWTQSDNGSIIDWAGAQQFCANLGGSWRLPMLDELSTLYVPDKFADTACGTLTCNVSPLFRISGSRYWTGTQQGSSKAWFVYLNNGYRNTVAMSYDNGHRALCTRRP